MQGEEKAGPMTLSIWALPLMQSGRVMRIILLVSDITAVREKERQLGEWMAEQGIQAESATEELE